MCQGPGPINLDRLTLSVWQARSLSGGGVRREGFGWFRPGFGLDLDDFETQHGRIEGVEIGPIILDVRVEFIEDLVFFAFAIAKNELLRTFVQDELSLWVRHSQAPKPCS